MSNSEMIAGALTPAENRPARALTAAEFQNLAEVPPEWEWFVNLHNAQQAKALAVHYAAERLADLAPVRQWRPGRVLRVVKLWGKVGGLFPEVPGWLMR